MPTSGDWIVVQDLLLQGDLARALHLLTGFMPLDAALDWVSRPLVGDSIKLGRSTYVVTHSGSFGLGLRGVRGAEHHLVQNANNTELWAHSTGGMRPRTTWYRWTAGGFAAVS